MILQFIKIKFYLDKYNRFIICDNDEKDIIDTLNSVDFFNLDYSNFDSFNSKKIAKEFINLDGKK